MFQISIKYRIIVNTVEPLGTDASLYITDSFQCPDKILIYFL